MAVTVTPVLAGASRHIATIVATADGDVIAVVPHGLGAAPLSVVLTMDGDLIAARSSLWGVDSIDATNVVLNATAAVGSGSTEPQLRVDIALPHSIVR